MASKDFAESLRLHREWGVSELDLKDAIYGKTLLDLTNSEAEQARSAIEAAGLSVYALSSNLFNDDIELGEAHFRARHLAQVDRLLELADAFRPQWVRLLAARSSRRKTITDIHAHLASEQPWLLPMYAEAVDRLHAGGAAVILENEIHGCILATPDDVLEFFRRLDRPGKLWFTLDIGNLWQEGTPPTVEVAQKVSAITRYLHLKGGQAEGSSPELAWQSSLADSSWPVEPVIESYLASGGSMICINPPHGARRPGYDYDGLVKRDLDFVQAVLRRSQA
ncbi:MAG TPA: TIM barrel protein [Polyangiaceae bacterium]|nr:TIM barrel protein [Polyangiaceae bacterium]